MQSILVLCTPAFVPARGIMRPARAAVAILEGVDVRAAVAMLEGVDVSDLGLDLGDLRALLPDEVRGGLLTAGEESTSRLPTVDDGGCRWSEAAGEVEVTLRIPGLRGQPAASLAWALTEDTATVTAFGRDVWSCVMRGRCRPDTARAAVEDGEAGLPTLRLTVAKEQANERWGGFIAQVGEDSML